MSRCRKLKAVVESGVLGLISSYHMKMVASGRGGWEVPGDSYELAIPTSARRSRAALVRRRMAQLSTALWLFGPVKEVRAWIGSTEIIPRHRS